MLKAQLFTLYPEVFPGPLNKGLYGKALDKNLWSLKVINIRDAAKDKHKTVVGDNSFIGSNSSLVAPVKIGNNTTIAAGSTITKDVPSDALGVGRSKQTNKDNWSNKKG